MKQSDAIPLAYRGGQIGATLVLYGHLCTERFSRGRSGQVSATRQYSGIEDRPTRDHKTAKDVYRCDSRNLLDSDRARTSTPGQGQWLDRDRRSGSAAKDWQRGTIEQVTGRGPRSIPGDFHQGTEYLSGIDVSLWTQKGFGERVCAFGCSEDDHDEEYRHGETRTTSEGVRGGCQDPAQRNQRIATPDRPQMGQDHPSNCKRAAGRAHASTVWHVVARGCWHPCTGTDGNTHLNGFLTRIKPFESAQCACKDGAESVRHLIL